MVCHKLVNHFTVQEIVHFSGNYSVSVERPCPMETVTFTCTIIGNNLLWEPSDVSRISVQSTLTLNEPLIFSEFYTVTLTAVTDTTITSTLSRTAEYGINVSCVDPLPNRIIIGSTSIDLVGEFCSVSDIIQCIQLVKLAQIHQDHLPSCLTLTGAVQLMQLV